MGYITAARNPEVKLIFKSRLVRRPKVRCPEEILTREDMIRETACIIMDADEGLIVGSGTARQHICDQDCKFTGQKRALEKAIKSIMDGKCPKLMRSLIWRQFFMRSKRGRELIGVAA